MKRIYIAGSFLCVLLVSEAAFSQIDLSRIFNRISQKGVTEKEAGQGIKEDDKAKIFRFHYSTKDSGSGVGLSIVKMITEYHGGRVEFESTAGEGSLFTLRFPKGREDGTENHHH